MAQNPMAKGVVFTVFLGCLLAACYAGMKWTYGEWSDDRHWRVIGYAIAGAGVCIGSMIWLVWLDNDPVWSDRIRRGFDVIRKRRK